MAYVDTSAAVAVAFGEAGHREVIRRVSLFDRLFSSNLLEAEFETARRRAGIEIDPTGILGSIMWVHPQRALRDEISEVLRHGYLRGADTWHLACALFLKSTIGEVELLTLDERQLRVGESLGLVSEI